MAKDLRRRTKDNYSAWQADFAEFFDKKTNEEKLRFLICFAVLAPSSHNSQPWYFKTENDSLHLFVNRERMLGASDPNMRQLFISLGCALENLIVAAHFYDLNPVVEYFPDDNNTDLAAKVKVDFSRAIHKLDELKRNDLAHAILSRRTNRNKYSSRVPDLNLLTESVNNWTEKHNIKANFILDLKRRSAIADVVLVALGEAMARKDFRKELSCYVKSNYTSSCLGMPGFGMGMPGPVSVVAPFLLKHLDMSKMTRKQDEALLKEHTPVFVILSTSGDDPESWIKAGQLYERLALEAERAGLKTAAMAAAIEIGNHYKELQRIMGITDRPQVFFRMGYCDLDVHPSPRLSSKDPRVQSSPRNQK